MSMLRPIGVFACLALSLAAVPACSSHSESSEDSFDELNYRSTAGQEYLLSAEVAFKTPADAAALQGDAKQQAISTFADGLRMTVMSAVAAELDKIWPEAQRTSRAGVAIQFRQSSASSRDLKPVDDGHSSIVISGEFAAVKDIESKLPLRADGGQKYLPVSVDVGEGPKEIKVTLQPIERSLNAYPKYLDLFADGLDISVHFGGDHNTPPQDVAHARSLYQDLVASGFRSPVDTFEALKADSGPLKSSMKVKGNDVEVRVRIFHVDMTPPDARQPLVDAYKQAMKDSDVIIYDGHAGRTLTYSGVVLAYQPARVSIPASTFKDIETSDKQQVYLFNGCETYTGYADKLYENPHRHPENTDVITTGNFSAIQSKANQVISFIHSLVDQKSGSWVPRSWDSILGRMNAVGERSWVHVYGVHGIDDNPKISPLADPAKVGASCANDNECGAPDSKCLAVAGGSKVCGAACADKSGCPNNLRCAGSSDRSSVDDMQCTP